MELRGIEAAKSSTQEGIGRTRYLCTREDLANVHVCLLEEGDGAHGETFRMVAG
jgi:hypothetical protein